ncbi:Ribosomal protein S25 [Pyrenophora tritici-repentis]|nr:Ribosomal protein S25 [Pyrenophora tritici-repentis]
MVRPTRGQDTATRNTPPRTISDALHTPQLFIHRCVSFANILIDFINRTSSEPRLPVSALFRTSAVKDKAQHAVVLDKQTNDKLQKDVQSYRLITVATLVDRLKINGSLARKALADLEANGQIKKVVGHSKLSIYTRAVGAAE